MLALARGVFVAHKSSKVIWNEIFSHYFNTADESIVLKVNIFLYLRVEDPPAGLYCQIIYWGLVFTYLGTHIPEHGLCSGYIDGGLTLLMTV